ncbi:MULTISPECIES: DNA methyltransferase [unclassified Vibrio]|uniref:DNA methyltransferase n=1 Tax=unclassified Vibrio TaxID=2614977 RepID=UPI0025549220|nr:MULTISPECIES: DNA methyltransferase [unclassified Vibrio]MDK9777720.1 DNA methylase [Vibrio sp. D401a]MDK9801146.1 DNA methylase [Vibrio sp. D406a]
MNQESLFGTEGEKKNSGPVECLGITFESDEARRAHFIEQLREKLKDPEFRAIEGFPIGTDEAILELSDPPYYTACPNPWVNEFIDLWAAQKQCYEINYHREPFAADVSEGKQDPIYKAHSYHTKVPHQAIMRYILHYTKPGDIILDSFCGSGMTAVAAQMCGDREAIEKLGYKVANDLSILDENGIGFSKVGTRNVVLNDLSPTASFISHNYSAPKDVQKIKSDALAILREVEDECGWMYETKHSNGDSARINYVVWSEVFSCPECSHELIFWDEAVDNKKGAVREDIPCPSCGSINSKKKLDRVFESYFDDSLSETVSVVKSVPVHIYYTFEGKRYEKKPDTFDYELVEKIRSMKIPHWFPTDRMMEGKETRRNDPAGITHVHHFYTKRNVWALASILKRIDTHASKFVFTGILNRATQMNRIHLKKFFFGGGGWNAGYLKGTLYVSSLPIETSIFEQWGDRLSSILRAFVTMKSKHCQVISTQSSTKVSIPDNSLDYVFIDPPFGANINYSELSSIWEYWLKVRTNNVLEAIENTAQSKTVNDYRQLMARCFREANRVLKPGRWITVEFSNTKASVWNSIQSALSEAGFVVANVSALDKKQGSFKAVMTPTAVKQDLVISAYKPSDEFSERFKMETDEDGVWDFVKNHLKYLPVIKYEGNELVTISERDPRILFDQVVAYFIRNTREVPLSSLDFQIGLRAKFSERDGMFFLPEQVTEYDKKRAESHKIKQFSIFVDDEASAIEWIRQELKNKPKTYSEIHPLFLNELSGWKKNELELELSTLLEQNFIKYDGKEDVPSQIHTYLSTNFKDMRGLDKSEVKLIAKAKDRWYVPDPNKAADLEKVRLRALLKEFETYKEAKKKIKQPRAEALRAGFNTAWEAQDFQTILDISAKIPPAVLQEDEKLLMFYDNALTLTSTEDDEW